MGYIIKDFVTHEELTADNLIRCFNGYLDTVEVIGIDEIENLLLYLDSALQLGGADLAGAVVNCIRVDLINR